MLTFVGLVASGTYLSNLIRDGGLVPKVGPSELNLVVTDVSDGLITLRLPAGAGKDKLLKHNGLLGLDGESSYNQVGTIVSEKGDEVQRQFFEKSGAPAVGERVRLDSYAYEGDPVSALGIPFEEVHFTSSAGQFPAWYIDGDDDTWVVIVHGRNASPVEALRVIPVLAEMGMPVLVINYRNDPDLPASEDGYHRYGLTEWEDLEGAIHYAMNNGARDVVLFGYSMGGGIVANLMYQSPLLGHVSAVVLDSPMLHLSRTIDWGGQQLGYPQFALNYAKFWAKVRFSVDYSATDYLTRSDELEVPIFLIHGGEDKTIPFSISEDFARDKSDVVTPYFIEGADHVLAWNLDPDVYEKALTDFLAAIPD